MGNISTKFGESIDLEAPLGGAPNPYFERKNTLNLNGFWDFCITEDEKIPASYDGQIVVPFAPETPLSGVMRHIKPTDFLHYRRKVLIPAEHKDAVIRIVFEAVDQTAIVYIDGQEVCRNDFGYGSFSCFIPLKGRDSLTLEVIAHDDTSDPNRARGKQSDHPGGIWYTPTSGIWGSVYAEFLPASGYLTSLDAEPDFDEKSVRVHIASNETELMGGRIEVFYKGDLVAKSKFDEKGACKVDLSSSFHPWSPQDPSLYSLVVRLGEDEVRSVFGFRKIERKVVGDTPFILLNGEPLFLSALLDQGYYPESGLTPPSVEAMENDIRAAKENGFNCLRKHIKIEPMRWYYLCDVMGMCVIQDFINGGAPYMWAAISLPLVLPLKINDYAPKALGRKSEESRATFEREMELTYKALKPVTSILVWTLFNEAWGQFQTVRLTEKLHSWDQTRLIDSTSGWYDKGVGDFSSHHIYFRKVRLKKDKRGRILSLSEFGGYSLALEEHMSVQKAFGYKKFPDAASLSKAFDSLYRHLVTLVSKRGLSVAVYTELTDVEEEVNGILTADRKVLKIDAEVMKERNHDLYLAYEALWKEANGHD